MEKKKKQYKPWIKRGPLKTFLFFLGFSAVIWLFVQFSKQYIEPVILPVTYVNIPKDKILDQNIPRQLELRVRDYGINIARYKLLPPGLEIDVSEAEQQDGKLIFDLQQQKSAILSQINLKYEDATFLQTSINIPFEQRAVKTVEIVPNIELGFAVGYSASEIIRLQPDSVRLSGPANILDTLKQVGTVPLKINNISKDIQEKIKLDTRNLGNINLFTNEVEFSVKTDKFTEGKVEIPVEMKNVPENMNVVLFPKEVTVYYQVSLRDYEKVTPENFKVVVDFENALESDGYLLAQVEEKPRIVTNVRLNEKRIQFVIKR